MNSYLLERFLTTAHWTLPGLWAIPLLTFLLYRSILLEGRSPDNIVALFLAGVLGWTFAEYWLHRWVFHFAPSGNRAIRAIQFALHGYHHEFPDDPNRLVAPPIWRCPSGIFLAAVVMVFSSSLVTDPGRGILRLSVLRLDALLLSSRSPAFQDRKIHAPLSALSTITRTPTASSV